MRKFLLFFAACAAIIGARAAEVGDLFTSDELRFRVESVNPPQAALISPANETDFEGDITVPATVAHDNVTYNVTIPYHFIFRYRVKSVTFDPEYSGALLFEIYSSVLEKLTLPKKVDQRACQITLSTQCPIYDVTMDNEGGKTVLTSKKMEIYKWDGTKAAYALKALKTDNVIYPDAQSRITVTDDKAYLMPDYYQNSYAVIFKFYTENNTSDQAVDVRFNIPEDYTGVTATDGLLEYSIAGGSKAVVKGFAEGKKLEVEDLTIPEKVNFEGKSLPVTKISYMAFDRSALKKLNLGKVEEIAPFGLYGCYDLKELYIPATLKKAGQSAFNTIPRCIIDPAAEIESDGAFGSPLIFINYLSVEGQTAKVRLHCEVYKNGKPIGLYLSRKEYNPGLPDIMPDEDGVFTVDKDWFKEEYNDMTYYSVSFDVRSTDPGIKGRLTTLSIGESYWTSTVTDPAEHIYIIGDVTAWNEPNNPESGINPGNSFKTPSASNADFYEAYKLPLVEKGTQLYAGNFYLPATEMVHEGASGNDYTTQFRFMTALTGWDTPEHVGADDLNFFVVPCQLDMYGYNAYMGGPSNWGIECYETTPVTVVVRLSDYASIWVKKGHYDVQPVFGWSVVEPIFIEKNSGVVEAATEYVDDNAPVEWYNLQGMRVAEPEHGVYIRRQGSRTTKVLVR